MYRTDKPIEKERERRREEEGEEAERETNLIKTRMAVSNYGHKYFVMGPIEGMAAKQCDFS